MAEPNIALNLEICDLVNSKQGSLPREACVAVVKLVNSRDPQVSELAIILLDYLVKNCGYPVHLQISRKEFLNELVKRFPERPPPAYSRSQRDILAIIAEWVHTICKTSRNKDDLTYIKDMYRLLRSKGYDFPAVKKEDVAVLNPSDNIKSIEELQKEEKIAQSAKLHELIRRGRPQDLKEANDLMKIMSGFKEDEALEETKQKVHEDLRKLERKVDILDEMLNNSSNQGQIDRNDETLAELISTVKVSQPRVQKIIQEEQGTEDVTSLLALNDKMNAILSKIGYLSEGEAQFNVGSAGAAAGNPGARAAINLIDFDDDAPSSPSSGVVPTPNDAIADLLGDLGGLSVSDNSGAINLLGSEPASSKLSNLDILSGFGHSQQTQSPQQPAGSPSPHQAVAQKPALDPFGFDFNTNASQAPTKQTLISTNNVTVHYEIMAKHPQLDLLLTFDNNTLHQLTNVELSLAVTKAFELSIQSASGMTLQQGATAGIKQSAVVKNRQGEAFNAVKFKFKLNYTLNGQPVEEAGVASIQF